jgi:hypothetical protein
MAISTSILLVLSSGLLLLLQSAASQSTTYNCTYSAPLDLSEDDDDDTVTLEHYVNRFENTITFRMTYEDGYAWLGLGINLDNNEAMVPSLAVIGDWDRRIQRYMLTSKEKDGKGVVALSDIHGHLKNGFFLQEDERSVLVFSQDLEMYEEDVVAKPAPPGPGRDKVHNDANTTEIFHEITVNSTWIWAVGRDDNRWDGRHKLYGSFILDWHDGCQVMGGEDEQDDALTENEQEDTQAPVPSPVEPWTPQNIPVLPQGDIMGDTVPIPVYNDGDDSSTGGIFDEISAVEEFQSEQLAYAKTRPYWIFHGILMGVAWGVLAPLTVGAALWRNRLMALQNGSKLNQERTTLWTRLHYCLCLSVALMTVLGFLLAILAKRQGAAFTDEKEAFSFSTEEMHAIMGMAILAMLLVQGIAEYMRRCLFKPNTSNLSRDRTSRPSSRRIPHNPSAHMMIIDGFSRDRRQLLPPQQGELPAPYGNRGPYDNDEGNYPSDISLLTSSVHSGNFAVLNLSSVLPEGSDDDTDVDNDQILGGKPKASILGQKDADCLPNASSEEDRSYEIIFADDDEDLSASAAAAPSRRQPVNATYDATNDKGATPATSPDTSREEVESPVERRRPRPSCCLTAQNVSSCWSCMLMFASVTVTALAWYNCHTGIMLQSYLADMEDFEPILLALFWGFAVGMVVLVSVMLFLARQSSRTNEP